MNINDWWHNLREKNCDSSVSNLVGIISSTVLYMTKLHVKPLCFASIKEGLFSTFSISINSPIVWFGPLFPLKMYGLVYLLSQCSCLTEKTCIFKRASVLSKSICLSVQNNHKLLPPFLFSEYECHCGKCIIPFSNIKLLREFVKIKVLTFKLSPFKGALYFYSWVFFLVAHANINGNTVL